MEKQFRHKISGRTAILVHDGGPICGTKTLRYDDGYEVIVSPYRFRTEWEEVNNEVRR